MKQIYMLFSIVISFSLIPRETISQVTLPSEIMAYPRYDIPRTNTIIIKWDTGLII